MKALLQSKKYGFIGAGNMSQAIMHAWISSGALKPENIYATNRSEGKLHRIAEQLKINPLSMNEELVDQCDVVVLAMKPQDLTAAVEPIASSFNDSQIVISLAAGIGFKTLTKVLPNVQRIVRIMPNTPARIRQAVVGYALAPQAQGLQAFVEDLFDPIGLVVQVNEGEEFEALTVSCGSGVGFVFELMDYWQEWLEEHNFDAETAKQMTIKTFLGAAMLADESKDQSIHELQNKVVSKKGVTAAGLSSMRELEVERALRYSFEKAVLRDRDLGRD